MTTSCLASPTPSQRPAGKALSARRHATPAALSRRFRHGFALISGWSNRCRSHCEPHRGDKFVAPRSLSFLVGMAVTLALLVAGDSLLSNAPAGAIVGPSETAGTRE